MCFRRIKEWFSIELGEPDEFSEPLHVIRGKLDTADQALANEMLEHARDLNARFLETSQSVERRATTLIGTVAIAASLAVAGGSLVVGASAVPDGFWRAAILMVLLALVFALVITAVCAFGAIQVRSLTYPRPEDVFSWNQTPKLKRDLDLAADLYYSFGRNQVIARNQVEYLKASGKWLKTALTLVVVLAAVFLAYSLGGPASVSVSTDTLLAGPPAGAAHSAVTGIEPRDNATRAEPTSPLVRLPVRQSVAMRRSAL